MTAKKLSAIGAAIVALAAPPAHAEVTRVDIVKRIDIAGSSYEKLAGTVHFAIDPTRPRNQIVVDLDKAPRNASGLVEFSSDLRPSAWTGTRGHPFDSAPGLNERFHRRVVVRSEGRTTLRASATIRPAHSALKT